MYLRPEQKIRRKPAKEIDDKNVVLSAEEIAHKNVGLSDAEGRKQARTDLEEIHSKNAMNSSVEQNNQFVLFIRFK